MAKYGNSNGNNTGKKYIKLKGGEVATPENEARAREFLMWYGANSEVMRRKLIYDHLYDDAVATDTMLILYDCIALKGLKIDNPKFYFLRSYHTNYLASQKRKEAAPLVSLDLPFFEGRALSETLAAPVFDYAAYEETIDTLKREITDYVRAHYPPAECSLFEIYIALQPDMSYKKLAKMLGFPVVKIWPVIGAIKKDITANFTSRKDYMLSLL